MSLASRGQLTVHLHKLARHHHPAVFIREDVAPERGAFKSDLLLKTATKLFSIEKTNEYRALLLILATPLSAFCLQIDSNWSAVVSNPSLIECRLAEFSAGAVLTHSTAPLYHYRMQAIHPVTCRCTACTFTGTR